MRNFALNHMTLANASYDALLETAVLAGCTGVEVRNDLSGELFDGLDPIAAGKSAQTRGLKIYAVAEVKAFNDFSDATRVQAESLMKTAVACGAAAISLVPRCDGVDLGEAVRQNNLGVAIRELRPMLESYGLTGLIEPLGFETASLRCKHEVIDAIEQHNASDTFKIVHDTFHHYLAGEEKIYPEYTAIVHVSGVINRELAVAELRDDQRILVDERDRLNNIQQLAAFAAAGFDGPVSVEAFSPDVHALTDPGLWLRESFDFITSAVAAKAA